ncbi:MAG TPA: VTT domain-containing protein, partial [Verrucomicrobiae bacterium]|nr:VTT domain-containing protein [Verrucomicrobiae bacterium]
MEEREGSWRTVAGVVLVAVAAGGAWWSSRSGLLSLENLRDNADVLRAAVERSYLRSALLYVLAYMTTALVLPGALVLTVAGGFLFGVIPAALLINIGGTLGALAGFAAARSLAGHALQERYSRQLSSFNAELELHGVSYLLMLRIVPLFPFFVVNVL